MIFCFGNSHAAIFVGGPPCGSLVGRVHKNTVQVNPTHTWIASVFMGPIIAYNFVEHHLPKVREVLETPETRADKDRDVVMLYVGEVDCRYHLAKRIMESGGPAEPVVEECADRFFEAATLLRAEGWKVALVGTHPTTLEPHSEDPDKPHWGDWSFRNRICVLWNEALRKRCEAAGVPFVCVYDRLVGADNRTRTDYYVDYCHLSYEKCFPMFEEELKRVGLSAS